MTSEKQALAVAIEELYKVFTDYPIAQKIDGCPCCASDEDKSNLHRKPLRGLMTDDLSRYAFKALTTWGTENDFKHFLPRLLELVTEADSIAHEIDVEVLFGKLHYADWKDWPEQERAAVRHYLMALWLFVLSIPMEAVAIDEYLCAIGQAEDDLSSYLDAWQNLKTDMAINHLIEFVASKNSLYKGRLTNAFWQGRREQMSQVVGWLRHNGLVD